MLGGETVFQNYCLPGTEGTEISTRTHREAGEDQTRILANWKRLIGILIKFCGLHENSGWRVVLSLFEVNWFAAIERKGEGGLRDVERMDDGMCL